jgi:alanine-glyoxylate transaminase/serine-glyoxylate transaminase/serine-pyruvate transaminase
MEAVARHFATDEHVMVLRNGWFSYRRTEIFEMGGENRHIPKSHTILKAQPEKAKNGSDHVHFAPYPVDQVIAKITEERPAALVAPHVETSTGMMLPDEYIEQVSRAMHDVGGLFLLDCIASSTVWADMDDLGVDCLITAPQKGWTGPPCAALVMLSAKAAEVMNTKQEKSFSMSLKRWDAIMVCCGRLMNRKV